MAHPESRVRLAQLTTYLRDKLGVLGIEVEAKESPAPIVAFKLGDRPFMQNLQRSLFD